MDSLAQASSDWLVFDPGVWSAVLLALAVFVLLRFTIFGRYTYAIGSNARAAKLAGVPVSRWRVAFYRRNAKR